MTSLITLLIYLATLANFYFQPVGEGIYNRGTYTVQTTGYLVSPTAKLTAGMQNRKYDFYCRDTCFVIDAYRNSSSDRKSTRLNSSHSSQSRMPSSA